MGAMGAMSRWAACLAAATLALMAIGAAGDALEDRIKASEDIVRGLQEEATALYKGRKKIVPDCNCSVHSCSNQFRETLVCTERMGALDRCQGCDFEGLRLDLKEPLVRTPPGSNPDDLTPDVIESLCTFKPLDESLMAAGETGNFMWTYIGTTTGTMRIWPGQPRERGSEIEDGDEQFGNCRPYDPRIRPWFISASSGPKDVVVLLDTSGSMTQDIGVDGLTRWDVTRDAVSRLLDSFGISDFVGIVTFNSEAEVLGGTSLARANETNIVMLQEALKTVEPDSGTDFGVGFEMAFDLLIGAAKQRQETDLAPTSSCTKLILFLTDGEDCTGNDQQPCKFGASDQKGGKSGQDLVLEFIGEKQSELEGFDDSSRAHIFSFSMTSDADDKLPKMISCENRGSWSAIEENDDPLFKFLDYSSFLAWGRRRVDVIWSNFYEDDGGTGQITSAALPVYSPDLKDVPGQLVGVVGHDVRLSDLVRDGEDTSTAVDKLIERASACRMAELSPCQLQVLRGEKAECPNTFDESPCFLLGRKYYTTDLTRKLSFEDAGVECADAGGRLAEITTAEEHWLVSSLSTAEGSWIGLQLDASENPLTWRWIESGTEVEDPFRSASSSSEDEGGEVGGSSLWASRAKDEEDCAAIDRRSVRNNVMDVDCKREMSFICEFDDEAVPEACEGDGVARVGRRGVDPVVPRITDCGDFESALAASTKLVKATSTIDSRTAVCSLGEEERTTEEVQCCCSEVGCVDEKDGVPCVEILVTNNG